MSCHATKVKPADGVDAYPESSARGAVATRYTGLRAHLAVRHVLRVASRWPSRLVSLKEAHEEDAVGPHLRLIERPRRPKLRAPPDPSSAPREFQADDLELSVRRI